MIKSKTSLSILVHVVLSILALSCLIPFFILLMSSLSSETSLLRHGYSLFPKEWSLKAYEFLWMRRVMLLQAYGITILITTVGTIVSLTITSLIAYALSRRDFPLARIVTFIVFFTMLFNGGLVPTYLIYTQVIGVKNTLFGLLLPGLLMNGFNVLIMRTFFVQNIPIEVLESAHIDGAGHFRTFFRIALPLSYPILATIGLLVAVGYWNDWYNGFIFLTDTSLFNIQSVLNRMLSDIRFIATNPVGGAISAAVAANMPSVAIRMAIAIIAVVPLLTVYAFFQKYFVKGIAVGAVKG